MKMLLFLPSADSDTLRPLLPSAFFNVKISVTHSAGLLPFMGGNMRSSVLGEGESLSPASRGRAALEELFSSEDEAEL